MSTVKSKNLQIGTDGTASNNFTIYQPGTPDGTLRVGNGNAGSATDVAKIDSDGFKFTNSIQIGTDGTASNNFTIYQPSTPDGTLRIGVGNADSPTEVGQFNANGYKPATAPAFEAYLSANQSVDAATWEKVTFDATVFDATSEFDTTNNRFQPSIAGYYQINTTLYINGNPRAIVRLYKNGSSFKYGPDVDCGTGQIRNIASSWLVYLNGTTDYLEVYAWRTTLGNILGANTQYTNFSGFLVQQS